MTKYVVSWTNREAGNAEKEAKRSLAVFSKWTPSQSSTFHQFVQRADGVDGLAFLESDSPEDVLRDTSKFTLWIKYDVLPVVDMADGAAIGAEAIGHRDSIS